MHFEDRLKPEESETALALQTPTKASTPRRNIVAILPLLFVKSKLALVVLLKMASFILSLWFYSIFFGWKFAALFMLLLATHELGHYVVMRRYGIDASLPSFIPGLGAMIFTRSIVKLSITRQAIVGMAGPAAGTAAAVACAIYGLQSHNALWIAAAYSGFFLNAFNLLPVPPLDGSHIAIVVSNRLWVIGLILFVVLSVSIPAMRNPFIIVIIALSIPSVLEAWHGRKLDERPPVALPQRLAFCAAYFTLAGMDLAGMLVTHLPY